MHNYGSQSIPIGNKAIDSTIRYIRPLTIHCFNTSECLATFLKKPGGGTGLITFFLFLEKGDEILIYVQSLLFLFFSFSIFSFPSLFLPFSLQFLLFFLFPFNLSFSSFSSSISPFLSYFSSLSPLPSFSLQSLFFLFPSFFSFRYSLFFSTISHSLVFFLLFFFLFNIFFYFFSYIQYLRPILTSARTWTLTCRRLSSPSSLSNGLNRLQVSVFLSLLMWECEEGIGYKKRNKRKRKKEEKKKE